MDLNKQQWLTNKMSERDFCSWFNKNIKNDVFYFKLSDQDQRIKPFDAFGVYKWLWLWMEFKKVDWHIVYPYKELKWSSPKNPWGQVAGLTRHSKHWWLSLVIVFSKKACRFQVFKFDELTLDTKYDFYEK